MFWPNIRLTVTGIDDAIARLDGLEQRMLRNITIVFEWFGRTTTNEMIADHEFINRTGQLERSIGYTVEAWQAGRATLLVFATAPYAQAVEEGTPSSRPYPFFWPVFYKWLPELQVRLQQAVADAFEGVQAGQAFGT